MVVAHLGIAVFVVGVTMVKGYGTENDLRMEPGDTTELAGYAFRFAGVREVEGPNYAAMRATLEVTRNGKPVTMLYPEKRVYTVQQNAMTEAAIDTGFTRDLYAALGDSVSDTAWVVRVQHKPFVVWIWGGCLLMALGGALAISDRRYRIASRPLAARSALQDGAAAAPAR
jgi:cytochrome c-type biogenesis protein CcmF